MDYRQYDNALGRFNSMDKVSEMSHNITPYRFGFNNPVFWSDPSGLSDGEAENTGEQWYRGRIQRNGEGGYDINNYETHTSYSSGNDKGFGMILIL